MQPLCFTVCQNQASCISTEPAKHKAFKLRYTVFFFRGKYDFCFPSSVCFTYCYRAVLSFILTPSSCSVKLTSCTSFSFIAVSEIHSSTGKAVQMFCSGDWDPKRVPQGTECLEPLLAAAPSHLPRHPPRCFTGKHTMQSRD